MPRLKSTSRWQCPGNREMQEGSCTPPFTPSQMRREELDFMAADFPSLFLAGCETGPQSHLATMRNQLQDAAHCVRLVEQREGISQPRSLAYL